MKKDTKTTGAKPQDQVGRFAKWCTELKTSATELAKHEAQVYARVGEFEADGEAWSWRGLSFDRVLEQFTGLNSARYRAFNRAVALVGRATAIDLGIDASVQVRSMHISDEHAAPLAEAVAERMRGFRRTNGHDPKRDKVRRIVRDAAEALGLPVSRGRRMLTSFEIAVGALEQIARSKTPEGATARAALKKLEAMNAIHAAA